MDSNLIGTTEAAKILGISTSVVSYHIANGNLKPVGKFGNAYILERAAVEAFIAKREQRKGAW
jgi:excisionase family DNA binding protein